VVCFGSLMQQFAELGRSLVHGAILIERGQHIISHLGLLAIWSVATAFWGLLSVEVAMWCLTDASLRDCHERR
jgi:hypothetical protein